MRLVSPTSGRPLQPAGDHALRDAHGERWPVVAGIPVLRVGRQRLVAALLERLDAGDEAGALHLALADQDDWDPTPPPSAAQCARAAGSPTLREAMDHLGFGAVADYFAFRWSDPTYLSGLALLDAAAPRAGRVFELACGVGAFLAELAARGVTAAGGDVVFAKLWLARRFVAPDAELVCFDAAAGFPLEDAAADLALCHDALHYLPDPAHALAELRRVGGRVAVGHAHNARAENLSPGDPLSAEGYAALAADAVFFDDAELAAAALAGRAPTRRTPEELEGAAAVAFVAPGPVPPAAGARPAYAAPVPGTPLRLNPLVRADGEDPVGLTVRWPSERYEREYAADSPHLRDLPRVSRRLVERPPAAGEDAEADALARRRILLTLPEAWG